MISWIAACWLSYVSNRAGVAASVPYVPCSMSAHFHWSRLTHISSDCSCITAVSAGCRFPPSTRPWPVSRSIASGPNSVVAELDGWAHHATRDAFESDRKRDARIQLAGHRIVRVTHRRITYEGDELEAEIRKLLEGW